MVVRGPVQVDTTVVRRPLLIVVRRGRSEAHEPARVLIGAVVRGPGSTRRSPCCALYGGSRAVVPCADATHAGIVLANSALQLIARTALCIMYFVRRWIVTHDAMTLRICITRPAVVREPLCCELRTVVVVLVGVQFPPRDRADVASPARRRAVS